MRPSRPFVILATVLAACAPAGVGPALPRPDGSAAPSGPRLVTPSRDPSLLAPQTAGVRPVGGGLGAAAPGQMMAGGGPEPSPIPSAPNKRVERPAYFFSMPGSWQADDPGAAAEHASVRPDYAPDATFTVVIDTRAGTLADRQRMAEADGKPGLVSSVQTSVDGVAGFVVTSNREVGDLKVAVVERGFRYRERIYLLTVRWDKRHPEAARFEREIKAMVASFRWL